MPGHSEILHYIPPGLSLTQYLLDHSNRRRNRHGYPVVHAEISVLIESKLDGEQRVFLKFSDERDSVEPWIIRGIGNPPNYPNF